MIGEGEYNLDDLIDIQVSDSYLGLDQDVIKCQNEGSLHDCSTRHYIDTVLRQCGCLPLNLRLSGNDPLCSPTELKCVAKVDVDSSGCLKPCSGMFVTSFSKSEQEKNLESLFPNFGAYDLYKKKTKYPPGYYGNKIHKIIDPV